MKIVYVYMFKKNSQAFSRIINCYGKKNAGNNDC